MSGNGPVTRPTLYEGASVEEAKRRGFEELGLDAGEVEVVVIDSGSRGFLGFGRRPARVRILSNALIAPTVRALTGEMLRLMGIEASVSARQQGDTVHVRIDSGNSDGLLIGRRGDTLEALQHVVGRMASRQTGLGSAARVEIDVGGYRERRASQIEQRARELAERVERTGRRAMTEPLTPAERRVVHRALSDNDRIRTHAAGSGSARRVVMVPARSQRGST